MWHANSNDDGRVGCLAYLHGRGTVFDFDEQFMSGRQIDLGKGFRIDKNGKFVRNQFRLSVNQRLRQKNSKRLKSTRKLTTA